MLFKQSKCFRFSTFNPSFCPWPLDCLSWDSARNCRILSEGIAKDIPAVTFSVLMPITSPSYSNRYKNQDTNVNVNSHKHTTHLHAQMSLCHNGMFPPLIIMHEHMCLWSRLTQHRALPPTYVSRLIKTCYKHYQPCLHSLTPVNSQKNKTQAVSLFTYEKDIITKSKNLTRFTRGPPELPYWNRKSLGLWKCDNNKELSYRIE